MSAFSTLWEPLLHWSEVSPDRPALSHGGRILNFAELAEHAERRAGWLAGQGVVEGDRVLIVGLNSLEWVIAYLGAIRLGAIAVPANNRISPAQMADLVILLEPRVALADEKHRSLFAEAAFDVKSLEDPCPPLTISLPPLPAGNIAALISFTSGTTGQPNGAVLSQNALYEASAVFNRYFATGPEDSTLVLAPMFHNTGFVDQFGQMLIAGGRTDLMSEFHRSDAIDAFRATPASFVTAVPSVLRMMMLMDNADAVFGPARIVLFGGSPMPAAWSRELLERWPHLRLVHGYGLTEFGSACSFLPAGLVETRGESVGFVAPGARLRLVDENGVDAIPGTLGEVWVAGPTRMSKYWRRPDITAEKLSGEWLRTGDLGRFDAEGLLFLEGRRDDVINRGGEKILPAYLESVLAERPDVGSCVVVGIPDPVLQQVPAAAVEVRPGHQFDRSAARMFMAAHLPAYAVPTHFLIFDPLPRIASGKIDRRAVRAEMIARLDFEAGSVGEDR